MENGNSSFSDDRKILVNYEEDGQGELLDNGYGSSTPGGGGLPSLPSLPSIDDTESVTSVVQADVNKFQTNGPVDRLNFTYIIFYLLGTTTMVPWNFFITAEDYWLFKFRNTTLNGTDVIDDYTPMQKSFTSDLTVTASASGTVFLILNAIYGHHVSLRLKMVGTLFVILALFIVTTVFVEIDTDSWQEGFFAMTMGTVVVLNICSAVMCGGLFGIAGLFPSDYMTAVVSGQALGGIVTALAFILTLTFQAPPSTTAFIFFSIGIVMVVVSIITYILMSRTHFFNYHVWEKSKALLSPGSSSHLEGINVAPNFKNVFRKIYVYAISECLVFVVTLSVYPAVTVLVQSTDFGKAQLWNDVYFRPVVNYLIFNSGDYFGRIISGLFERPKNNPHLVLLFTIVRVIFIPLLMTANIVPHYFLPTIISSDTAFICIMVALGLTNGYFANISLIMVPKVVAQHEKEMASSIMAASLSLGLLLGACMSMLLVQLV